MIALVGITVKISKWISMEGSHGYYRRIRDLREDHDLTQRQLAAKLGMTQTQYFRYEQGYRDVPSDILIALADLYQTSTDYILGRTDDPRFFGGSRR